MILRIKCHFDSAHCLPNHEGQCKNLHGHTWHVEVCLKGFPTHRGGPSEGMILDFKTFKTCVKKVIDQLDHKYLNDIFPTTPTTCENIAQWIKTELIKTGLTIESVTAAENDPHDKGNP